LRGVLSAGLHPQDRLRGAQVVTGPRGRGTLRHLRKNPSRKPFACGDISRYLGCARASEPALSCIIKLESQKESLDRGCRDISGVIGPLAEGAEVSDDGRIADDESSRRAGTGVALLHAVYTTVQTLELRGRSLTLSHSSGRPAYPPGGAARSANLSAESRSALRCLRRGDRRTSWDRAPQNSHINVR
jgi:hypothetical protein